MGGVGKWAITMDRAERQRLKTLANDAIIELFGSDSREQRLAEALETAITHIEYLRTQWRPVCYDCDERLMTFEETEELEAV